MASSSFRGSNSSGTDLTTYTFAGIDLGAAPAAGQTRHVLIAAGGVADDGTSTRDFSSVTIGGVAATLARKQVNVACAGLYIAAVPTGATGDVVIVWSGAMARTGLLVWALYDIRSLTPTDTEVSTADPAVLSVDAKTGDLIFTMAFTNAAATMSWTGVTEDADTSIEGAYFGGGSHQATVIELPRTVSGDYSTVSGAAGVSAVFSPYRSIVPVTRGPKFSRRRF